MSVEYALKINLPDGGIAFGAIDADGSWRLAAMREWPRVAGCGPVRKAIAGAQGGARPPRFAR